MKRAFREAYNRELALLKERTAEFAHDYPGLADRLGGLMEENLDPSVAGLLEGTAFLAARVQLKMQEEFRTFTRELLDQVFPDALVPTPSVMLVQARLPSEKAEAPERLTFAAGEYLDARFVDGDKRVSCRYALAAPLVADPVTLTTAQYHASPGPVGALGQEIAQGTRAGLVLSVERLGPGGSPESAEPFSALELDDLAVHLVGPMGEAARLYEQVFCDLTRVSLRWLDDQGDPVFVTLPPAAIEQLGFGPEDRLFPHRRRVFQGFARLREFFVFPRKFLGFRLTGLGPAVRRLHGSKLEIVFEFTRADRRLATRLEAAQLALNTAPAVNLFEETSSQVRIDRKHHEHIVTPNSSPLTHYEFHDITEVWAHFSGHQDKVRVSPLYALPPNVADPREVLYYTQSRRPRRLTAQERRFGTSRYRYRGTETFLSIYQPPDQDPVQRLQVRGLCSNRHLPEYLPIAQGSGDFHFCEDQTITLDVVAGPTPPRDALADLETDAADRTAYGEVYWRLISYLSLNHFFIDGRDAAEAAGALREMLSLFADLSETVNEAQIAAIRAVETRPITRSVALPDGFHAARGLEVTVTFDEEGGEHTGIVLFGAVLDRFLAEYASINSFTQTVVHSVQRGRIKAFPPRIGTGATL